MLVPLRNNLISLKSMLLYVYIYMYKYDSEHVHCAGCFICCMDSGVQIYNVEPLAEKIHLSKFL